MKIFRGQIWHLLILIVLLILLNAIANNENAILDGELWENDTSFWLLLAVISPVLHQIYVLIIWRLELHYKTISKYFGYKGFRLFKTGFSILILSRLVTITLLAISNSNTFNLQPAISYFIIGIIAIPIIYLFYSVVKYFGMDRAFGIDHFEADKIKYLPFVRQGIYKYTSNGMYIYGFLILWIPGLLMQSQSALLIALFNHIYIWVHYYFTEKPDFDIIYSSQTVNKQPATINKLH